MVNSNLITKILTIFIFSLFFSNSSYSNEKYIYCLDLDSMSIGRSFTAYKIEDVSNSNKCDKKNLPISFHSREILKIPKELFDNYRSIAPGQARIRIDYLQDYLDNNNINYNVKKYIALKQDRLNKIASENKKKTNSTKDYCNDKIEFKWRLEGDFAIFSFQSVSEKPISILDVRILTNDEKNIKTDNTQPLNLKAYGYGFVKTYIGDLNKNVFGYGSYRCKFGQVLLKSYKSGSSNYNLFTIIGLIIGLGFIAFVGYSWYDAQNPNRNKKEKISDTKIRSTYQNTSPNDTIVSKVWNGNETMSKTFWLYCILLGFTISIIFGVLAGLYSNLFIFIAMVYFVWSSVGLWNSSNKYKQMKLQLKKPYGWSIAAKIWVILNLFTVFAQTILTFTGTQI